VAKLRPDAISEADLQEFVACDSDFGFEMRVLGRLRALGFECSHSGTYQDPVTEKIRQFDIRAVKRKGNCVLSLGVECKNLRENHPLLLSAVPRTASESFHQVIAFEGAPITTIAGRTVCPSSIYRAGDMVGKKTDQIGRDASGELLRDDSGAFEKLNQAVNSCKDLVVRAVLSPPPDVRPSFTVVVPVLVVPSQVLWQVDYAEDGSVQARPRRLERSSLFIDHTWPVDRGAWGVIAYRLSHLEVVTLDGLARVVSDWLGLYGFFAEHRNWLGL
jgi:hypothetical protein